MKAKCIPCLGKDVKEAIRSLNDPVLNDALDKVEDCPDPLEIQMCVKPPRAKSEYQVFIGECMRSKPIKGKPFGEASKYMKQCAAAWRQRKEERNNGNR